MLEPEAMRMIAARVLMSALDDLDDPEGWTSTSEVIEFLDSAQCEYLCGIAGISYEKYRGKMMSLVSGNESAAKGSIRKSRAHMLREMDITDLAIWFNMEGIAADVVPFITSVRIVFDNGKRMKISHTMRRRLKDVEPQADYMAFYRGDDEEPIILMSLEEFIWLQKRRVNA